MWGTRYKASRIFGVISTRAHFARLVIKPARLVKVNLAIKHLPLASNGNFTGEDHQSAKIS